MAFSGAGATTPNTLSVEELNGDDSVVVFSSNWLGPMGFRVFFGLKPRGVNRSGCTLAYL